MGVTGLFQYANEVSSRTICLRDGGGVVIVDGHFELHRAASRAEVALPLVLNNDIKPLALTVVDQLKCFHAAGWDITVVFDGDSPPSKCRTAQSRSSGRREALEVCRQLSSDSPHNRHDLERAAKNAVSFSSEVVARVARLLGHVLPCNRITSPYESDPQLKLLEDFYLGQGRRVLVRACDSDLIVLGVRSVLHKVWYTARGELFGEVVELRALVRPQMEKFTGNSQARRFLRALHGVNNDVDLGRAWWWPESEKVVLDRLRLWASVAGNDYSKFDGIGPATATELCLQQKGNGELPSADDVVGMVADKTGLPADEIRTSLKRSWDMVLHPVVYHPATGRQMHLSGISTSPNITNNTGVLAPAQLATQIALQQVCPITRRPWPGFFPDTLHDLPTFTRSRLRQQSRHPVQAETHNYNRTGFTRLPDNAVLERMNVDQLREFLTPFRCLEQAGTSTIRKAELLAVAKATVHVITQSGFVGNHLAFRRPQTDDRSRFQQPDAGWVGWEDLRPHLPEFGGDAIIIAWLRSAGSLSGETGRVLYRGMERVMDLGALSCLSGVPCHASGGTIHLRMQSAGSMREKTYLVQADVRVERVDEIRPTSECDEDEIRPASECDENGGTQRLVATEVQRAWCQCQSGAGGGCHHCCQLLQLVRLLQLTDRELETWDPMTPTSVACQWILKNCGGRSGGELDVFHRKTVGDVALTLRKIRNPKRGKLMGRLDDPASTRGVVAVDRRKGYSSHPDYGKWARHREHFNEGKTYSARQWAKLSHFIDGERGEGREGHTIMGIDVLRPIVRPDSP